MDINKRQEMMQESRFNLASLNALTFEEVQEKSKADSNTDLTIFYTIDGAMNDYQLESIDIDSTENDELSFATVTLVPPAQSPSVAFVKPTYGETWFVIEATKLTNNQT